MSETKIRFYGVESSQLQAIGYNPGTRVLVAQFKDGTIYRYDAVPPEIVAEVLFAGSVGKMFNALVKARGFAFKKITPVEAFTL